MSDPIRFRDDPVPEEPAVSMDAFLGQSNAVAVRVEGGDEVRELIPHLDRIRLIEIDFPRFRDGRGYSAARILREAGYRGELRAAGDVLVDQLFFMRRCGFDSFSPEHPISSVAAHKAFSFYDHVYQPAADGRTPIWKLRHG